MLYREFLRDMKAKSKKKDDDDIEELTSQIQFPTGFIYLDYICGNYIIPENDDGPVCKYHNIGMCNGSVNMVIAKSQGGKSTLAAELGAGILEPWLTKDAMKRYLPKEGNEHFDFEPKPLLQYIDVEKTATVDYLKKTLCMKSSMLKRCLVINKIDTDRDLYRVLNQHVEFKKANMQKVAFPMRDAYDDPIYMYPPTVVVVDSITQLEMEKVDGMDEKAYEAQMQNPAGAQRAKVVSQVYKQLVNTAKTYNIIIFCINHINKAPQMGFLPQPKQYHGLKPDETISGGERALYLAANILRLDRVKNIGTEKASYLDLGEGVTGFIVNASFIKNKSNSKRGTCFLIYTNRRGYCPILSTLYTMRERGDLAKSGNFHYLDDLPSIKFTLKNCLDVFADHPEMITALYRQCVRKCEPLLDGRPFSEIVAEDAKHAKKVLESDDNEDDFSFANLTNSLV